MNNLRKLRNELGYTTRDLQDATGIAYSNISLLEAEKRPFREAHIKALTAFFNVTTDYLLGKSDVGYICYAKDSDDDQIVISESDYLSYKNQKKLN